MGRPTVEELMPLIYERLRRGNWCDPAEVRTALEAALRSPDDWLDSFLAMLGNQGLSYCPECMNIAADADEGDTSCQHEARPLTSLERDHAREYIVATLTLRSTGDGNG